MLSSRRISGASCLASIPGGNMKAPSDTRSPPGAVLCGWAGRVQLGPDQRIWRSPGDLPHCSPPDSERRRRAPLRPYLSSTTRVVHLNRWWYFALEVTGTHESLTISRSLPQLCTCIGPDLPLSISSPNVFSLISLELIAFVRAVKSASPIMSTCIWYR